MFIDTFFLQDWCRKGQKDQPPNQKGRDQMNSHVKNVITQDIKLAEMIIKGQGIECKKTKGVEFPDTKKIMDILDRWIIRYIRSVIEMKRRMEGVRINNDP